MPPKKKRGSQSQGGLPPGAVSTRSQKKTSTNVAGDPNVLPSKKGPGKRGRPAKSKRSSQAYKTEENIDVDKKVDDDGIPEPETTQDATNCDNSELMESEETKDVEAEISEQLENLGVATEPVAEIGKNPVVEIGNYGEIVVDTVEYYDGEEIVETNEIVIEETNDAANVANEVNLELLEPNVEQIIGDEKKKDDEIVYDEAKEDLVEMLEAKDDDVPETVSKEDDEEEILERTDIVTKEEIKEDNTDEVKKIEEKLEQIEEKLKKRQKAQKPRKKIKKPLKKDLDNSKLDDENLVRRSNRIKSISIQQRSKGLVKPPKPPESSDVSENSNNSACNNDSEKSSATASPSLPLNDYDNNKPVKVKSRWRRSSELEMNVLTPAAQVMESQLARLAELNKNIEEKPKLPDEEVQMRLRQFVHLKENLYLTERLSCKEAKKMTCDCFLTSEEIDRGEFGCGEDCLNRLLMIECGNLCQIGDRCTNKKFQKGEFAPVEVFKTDKKGLGLRATANIPYGEFILEYVGEVLDHEEFDVRADDYSNDKNTHYYFMSLRADAIIDATRKGNVSRFINHSCEPNAETQKWTVNGELRIGFFSTRTILAGEEITFDYRFQRYGKEAQKCYCEAPTCRGWLGEEPEDDDDDEDDDDEEEVEEECKEEKTEEESAVAEAKETKKAEKKIVKREKRKRLPRKPRKDIFEDLDLDEEIEMLIATGLKNQAHTLKLSRLMVRAKEPPQRTKLMRILRRGELPCRRLFLDYHGLRLMHGYMIDAQQLAKTDKKYESLKLEMLQTLATLPIPNKTMLQDSKVLPTVEKWSNKDELPMDSDSCSPQIDQDTNETPPENQKHQEIAKENAEIKIEEAPENADVPEETPNVEETSEVIEDVKTTSEKNKSNEEVLVNSNEVFQDDMDISPLPFENKNKPLEPEPNYEEEIIALALKLLEEWSNLKEVFKIPKKERIEQMKEHEREANRGYIAGLGLEQDVERKNDSRYRGLKRFRTLEKTDANRNKNLKLEDRTIVNFPKLGKHERRKMFALQVEQREEERRRKQREMWRQHEQHCILLGTDPRLTAPFDPNRGYQCIWNPQIGQWQNYPLPGPQGYAPNQAITNLNMPPPNPYIVQSLPSLPYQDDMKKDEDLSQVKFMGPIPPPVKLPPKWKCAKDKYGRPYYYHIKIRKSQWEPPPYSQPQEEPDDSSSTTSSSDTSSLSSDTSSDDTESDDDVDDARLLQDVRKQMEKQVKLSFTKPLLPILLKTEEEDTPSSVEEEKIVVEEKEIDKVDEDEDSSNETQSKESTESKEEKPVQPPSKKRRSGLVQEIIISPRTEEDRLQFREDLKRYKQNKEKLKKQKELILQQSKKHLKDKKHKSTIKAKMKEMADCNSEQAKKIKEAFRSNMATVVVSVLNAYRKPDCKEGRITNTEDFKHLARKLTHFVMLKEMKHIDKIEDLVCTENVKAKAKEYIRKYMSKFGENYQKRHDEPDF